MCSDNKYNMDREYTIEEIKNTKTSEEVTEMLKHNKSFLGLGEPEKEAWVSEGKSLRDKFIEPPFSVLDTKTGFWQKRKKGWLELGIKSEESREGVRLLTTQSGRNDYMPEMKSEVSIFDPALCELMYKWFCPMGGGNS